MSKKKQLVDDTPQAPPFDPSVFVKLNSGDGHVFFADRNCVRTAKLLRDCLAEGGQPADAAVTPLGIGVERSAPGSPGPAHAMYLPFLDEKHIDAFLRWTHAKYKADMEPSDQRSSSTVGHGPYPPQVMLALATLLRF